MRRLLGRAAWVCLACLGATRAGAGPDPRARRCDSAGPRQGDRAGLAGPRSARPADAVRNAGGGGACLPRDAADRAAGERGVSGDPRTAPGIRRRRVRRSICSPAGCSHPAPPYRPWSTRSTTSGWSTARSPWRPPTASRACQRRRRQHRNRTRPAPPRRGAARDGTARGRSRSRRTDAGGRSRTACPRAGSRPPCRRSTRATSATLLASRVRVNMLSPKKAAPSDTPYRPPASRPPAQASTLCA